MGDYLQEINLNLTLSLKPTISSLPKLKEFLMDQWRQSSQTQHSDSLVEQAAEGVVSSLMHHGVDIIQLKQWKHVRHDDLLVKSLNRMPFAQSLPGIYNVNVVISLLRDFIRVC